MASSKRNLSEFNSYEGRINTTNNFYEFPTLFSQDSEKRQRQWRIMARLIKPNGKIAYGQNWNLLADNQLPITNNYLDVGVKILNADCQVWIEQGLSNGQISRYPPTYTECKNIGKKNERNILQQALILMRSKYLKRLEEGAKTDVRSLGTNAAVSDKNTFYWCMLATKYKEEFESLKFPAYAQIKMNGIRMMSWISDEKSQEVYTYSRDWKEIPGITHIKKSLQYPLSEFYNADEQKSMRVDGELFGFDVPLNLISGWARNPAINSTSTINFQDRSGQLISGTVSYFIFDLFDPSSINLGFNERLEYINTFKSLNNSQMEVISFPINIRSAVQMAEAEYAKTFSHYKSQIGSIETKANRSEEQEFLRDEHPFNSFDEWSTCIAQMANCQKTLPNSFNFEKFGNLVFVPTIKVNNKAELLCLYYSAVDQKFEGLMARNLNGIYATSTENKTSKNRSNDLQKLKPWYDAEFELIGFTSGKGRNQNAIIWICKTTSGFEFNCDPKNMSIEQRKILYSEFIKNPDKFDDEYKGRLMTVQYEEKNIDTGIPQRAKALGIRDMA
jgi:hypothetical protein